MTARRSDVACRSLRCAQMGFSLVEVMVTVVILGILALIVVPGFGNLLSNNRAQSMTQGLRTAVALAQSESMRLRNTVRLCGSNAAGTACNGGTNWSAGWLVVTDLDGDGNDEVVRSWEPSAGGPAVTSSAANIRFGSLGTPSAAMNVSVSVDGEQRCVRVLASGQTFTEEGVCN